MIDTDKSEMKWNEGDIIDERDIHLPSLMTYMAFTSPEELDAVKQAIHDMDCDVETVRWAVDWWQKTWCGIPEETLEYLGISDEE